MGGITPPLGGSILSDPLPEVLSGEEAGSVLTSVLFVCPFFSFGFLRFSFALTFAHVLGAARWSSAA